MNSFKKHFTISTLLLSSQLIILIWKIADDLAKGFAFDSWNVTELLINYEGGFVRRGLLGQIVFESLKFIALSPYQAVILICLLSIAFYFYLFTKGFLKKKIPLFIIPSVLLLGTPVLTAEWIRKDILIVLFFIACVKIYFLQKKYSVLLSAALLAVGIFVHESLFFLTFPTLILFNLLTYKSSSLSTGKLLPFLIPFSAFLLACLFSGNQEVTNAILDSWSIKDKSVENAVTSLSWSLEFGVRIAFAQGKAFTDNGLIFPPLIWLLVLSCVFYLLVNIATFQNDRQKCLKYRKFMIALVSFQLLSVAPLFILGCDYGRWIFYWSSISIATFLFTPEKTVDMINSYIKIKDSFFTESIIFSSDKRGIYILFLVVGIPSFIMNTQNYLNSTFIYQFIIKLSFIFNLFI
ncbi:hypothetical protein [Chryseobacterium caseinilyticum]|uniref:Glycosyltransferase RgtA/B/C/D-like domain-containing protein n=1 Tax=Chryseobacterium caseinilyticum TaxID=2771428 RepID=A0ABR8ZGE0_9FLAO|nr:hypothetical protein [Chryseobacterium caseinilyticum]MBD8084322.1 hypothetical protein [Chryseobacterium caseinilyticum]